MADLPSLIRRLQSEGAFTNAARLPGLTIGLAGRRYLGAEILPVRLVTDNIFYERGISYRTVLANTGTRYSPVTLERNVAVGSMLVELGEIDAGDEFTAADYDALVDLLGTRGELEATAQALDWSTRTLALPIQERLEKQRWEALDDAQVVRKGNNGYLENVAYPNPSGHRVTSSALTDNAVDPIEALLVQQQLLASKGYTAGRIITSTRVASLIARHPLTRSAIGGAGNTTPVRVTRDVLNGYLNEFGLPGIETYDLTARNADGTTVRFKRENALTIVAATGRTATLDLPDGPLVLPDTLGYTAIGRAAGQPASGIVVNVEPKSDKPVRLQGEAYATAGVVNTDPESVAVVNFTLPA